MCDPFGYHEHVFYSIIPQNGRIIESFMVELAAIRKVLILRSFGQYEHRFYFYYIIEPSSWCKVMVEFGEIRGILISAGDKPLGEGLPSLWSAVAHRRRLVRRSSMTARIKTAPLITC